MRYFKNINTLEDLKKEYRNLAKMYHPDLNKEDTTEIMKAINKEYDELFARVKNHHRTAEGETYEKETDETVDMFRDIINAIINLDCDIEIIGTWVWCFNAKDVKDTLKALGFKWVAKRKAWAWHTGKSKRSKSHLSDDELRIKYGCTKIKSHNSNTPATV